MKLEIEISEQQYNNIMELQSVNIGRVPYKGIIMYAVNAIKRGKALGQKPRKGKWIKTPKAVMGEGYMWYCDKCNHEVYQDSSRSYPSENFCPNCGSDNREVEE